MAGHLSDYLRRKVLDHAFGGPVWVPPPVVWVAAYNVAPTGAGGGTEVAGYAYARVDMAGADWNAAAGTATTEKTNAIAIVWPTASGGAWGTIAGYGILDASGGGNLLAYVTGGSAFIANGDTLRIPAFAFGVGAVITLT